MLRRLLLAATIALSPSIAHAQFATIGATPATSDSSDKLATTAWVNAFAAGSIPLQSGKIFIGSASNLAVGQTPSGDCTLSLSGVITCTQAAGNFLVNGSLTVNGLVVAGSGELMTNIVAPATPAAGTTRVYVDSTQKVLTFKNDAGTVGNAVVPSTAVANQFMTGISAAGVITRAQPNFTDLAGQGSCAQEPALTGGVTSSAGSCATTVATNANLTGPVTSVGNATTIGANQVTRAMEAQGVARSVVGVAGNATANVGDIQLSASQFLGTNAGGTSLGGIGYGPGATAAAGQLPGEPGAGSASAGNVGEIITATQSTPQALTTGTPLTIVTLPLTAGDWEVSGTLQYVYAATTVLQSIVASSSSTTNTLGAAIGQLNSFNFGTAGVTPNGGFTISTPVFRYSLSTSQNVFIVAQTSFTTSTVTATATGRARRAR